MRLWRPARFNRLSLFGMARTILLLGVGLGLSAVALIAYGTDAFRSLELRSVDARFSIRGVRAPPKDVAVVAVDRSTLERIGPHPIPRSKYVPVLRRLRGDGARVIAVNVIFDEPTRVREDLALYDAIRRARNVVLSAFRVSISGNPSQGQLKARADVFGGARNVTAAHAVGGYAGLSIDPDGRVRRVPSRVSGLATFPVAAAERANGREITSSSLHTKAPLGAAPADPLSGADGWIDFYGPHGTIPATPFWKVAAGHFRPGSFRGKVVVVGVTDPKASPPTPTAVDRRMPDLELQANAVASALHGFPLKDSPRWLDVVLVLVLGLVPALASLWLRARWTLLAAVVAIALYVVAVQLAFDHGTVLPLVYPVAAVALATVGVVPVRYVTGSFERTRGLFERFVPAAFARTVIAEGHDLRAGGEALDATVMFADLRGFTTFAESLPPDEVIDVVNRYLEEMSDAVLDQGGTVVSYFGDGIMAVFGAPHPQADHAERAVAAADDMLGRRLARFNEWLAREKRSTAFKLGIGLNSGQVISGTVGSERRLEYAAIGDTTNTAARLQAMTKETGTALLLAQSTIDRIDDGDHAFERVGALAVRGRDGTIEAWTLASAGAPAGAAAAPTTP